MDVAPTPNKKAQKFAFDFGVMVTHINGRDLATLFRENSTRNDDPRKFGYYLAFQSTGAGVSWWDDHDPGREPVRLPDTEVSLDVTRTGKVKGGYMEMSKSRSFVAS
jgi:hypothetical protein